jgi:hypothetical protein
MAFSVCRNTSHKITRKLLYQTRGHCTAASRVRPDYSSFRAHIAPTQRGSSYVLIDPLAGMRASLNECEWCAGQLTAGHILSAANADMNS